MLHPFISNVYYRSKPAWNIYKSLEHTQHLTLTELQQVQFQKLRKVVDYSQTNFSFWQRRFDEYGVSLQTLTSLDDLQNFPILEKRHLKAMISECNLETHKLVTKRTGGTTGQPVTIYSSKNHVYWSMAAMLRFYDWVGYKVSNRRAKLFAAPTRTGIPEDTFVNRVRNWLSNTLYLDALDLTPEKVERVVLALRTFQPQMLLGYTSCMAIVARTLQQNDSTLGLPNLKIVNAAEPLDPHKKETIEAGLGGTLFDHYGTRDVGNIADECEYRNGLHVHMEYVIVEIVNENGKWVQEGEEGEIIITELENFGMPILRYRIGDRAVRTHQSCPCGRGLQVIPAIIGRNTDIIILPNGNRLTGLVFPHTLKDFPIAEYQIIQKQLDTVEVKIVLDPGSDDNTLRAIHRAMQRIMPDVTIKLIPVANLHRSKSGKLRSVISALTPPVV